MENKWSNMSGKDKVLTVLAIVFGVVAIFFAVADFAELMPNADSFWNFFFAAMLVCECAIHWKAKRTSAIIELVCAVVLLGLGVAQFIM